MATCFLHGRGKRVTVVEPLLLLLIPEMLKTVLRAIKVSLLIILG